MKLCPVCGKEYTERKRTFHKCGPWYWVYRHFDVNSYDLNNPHWCHDDGRKKT